ncbi:protein SMAX1-LIKE 3-like protein [Cinnamomum micranthum f. kanehirae]|uniref:Protein SMAX1-LIKE 3-like protein n=1 Tax=Cinnamomum micranthum f. kanehirae TaxID=337451 RepID=A0A3S4NVU6_9MAGN|nr:protein SMAX1-LIKE 3-like protein [Cinnamomum micranthum f. kanehirae]
MRAGGCTLQQTLTVEAASIVKQANCLPPVPFPPPLQCKALELCFNVALNRLPTSTPSPVLGHHSQHPSLSNALVAAFKRAQAHQRRGSVENQQQPLLAVKVELEQLIISILDDPSVSRVMKEAGFSSTQVKSNVEQAVSIEICASSAPVSKSRDDDDVLVLGSTASPSPPPMGLFGVKASKARREDVICLMEILADRRRKSTVIVGECLASSEDIVRGVMDRVDKGEVPEALQNVQFITFPLSSYVHLSKGEVEQKLGGIRSHVRSCVGRGFVLYLGDLKWAAEYMASEERSNYRSPLEHMLLELGGLVCGVGESRLLRVLGISTYKTYMRCRVGHPSLETVLCLHPLTLPTGSLGLSLSSDSDSLEQLRNMSAGNGLGWSLLQDGLEKNVSCFVDCSDKFEKEAHILPKSSTLSLPSWLQQYKEENTITRSNDQECLPVRDLCNKWNSICNSVHRHHYPPEETQSFSSVSPSSSISSYGQHYTNLHQTHQTWPIAVGAKHPWKEHFWISDTIYEGFGSNSRACLDPKPVHFANPNPNTSPNSDSSSNTTEMEYYQRFKELNAENLKTLCNALEDKVPWQQNIIPEISSTILQCRSGMRRRKEKLKPNEIKEDAWLLFQGEDTDGKEKIARELATLIFGSQANFISIGSSTFSSPTRSNPTEDYQHKRSRDESSCSYLERFADAVSSDVHRVFLMEDIEQMDNYSQLGIKSAIERGRVRNSDGDEVRLCDAIIILSCENLDSRSRASSPIKQRFDTDKDKVAECEKGASPSVSLDLNLSLEEVEEPSFDNMGLLIESVDGRFAFNLQHYL